VLDGDPVHPSPKRGRSPPIFGLCLLWPNGWMDQDGTWRGVGPQSRPHCARGGPSSPPQKGAEPPAQFSANFCCDQMAGWIKMPLNTEVHLGPGNVVFDGVAAPPPKRGTAPQFSVHVYCGQTAGWMKTPHGTDVELGAGHVVLEADSAPPGEKGTAAFSAYVCWGYGCPSQLLLSSC